MADLRPLNLTHSALPVLCSQHELPHHRAHREREKRHERDDDPEDEVQRRHIR